jgi:flagellar hook-basal body complex protein FliE
MPLPILPVAASALSALVAPATAAVSTAATAGSASPFAAVLHQAVQQVESFHDNATTSINRFLNGEGDEIHNVAVATQEADLSFQLFMQVRNKVVSAYQQIMQMQV